MSEPIPTTADAVIAEMKRLARDEYTVPGCDAIYLMGEYAKVLERELKYAAEHYDRARAAETRLARCIGAALPYIYRGDDCGSLARAIAFPSAPAEETSK